MRLFLLALLAVTFMGCEDIPKPGSKCKIADDQKASFMGLGAIQTLPASIYIPKNLPKEDVAAIGEAIFIWNDFAQNYGRRLFNYKYLSANAKEVDGIEIIPDPLLPTLGKTVRGYTGDGINPARMRIYYAQGISKEDLTWVLVHEIGHVIGLNHSCHPSKDTANYVGCYKVEKYYDPLDFGATSHPYVRSIMYPNFVKIIGDVKHWKTIDPSLDSNTINRAYCLLFAPK